MGHPGRFGRRTRMGVLLCLVLCASVLSAAPARAQDDAGSGIEELVQPVSGATRYETAVAVSQVFFEPADVDAVFIASGTNFPDALVAGPVAAGLGVPILLTDPAALPASTVDELQRLDVETVHVLGGTAAITEAVVAELRGIVSTVRRWSGPDRYATAAAILDEFFPTPVRRVVVATGSDFHDPLAAAAFGARGWVDEDGVHQRIPLLITSGAGPLEPAIRATIERLQPGQVIVVGPPDAIVADTREELRRVASGRDEAGEFLPPPRFVDLDPTVEAASVGGTGADGASLLAAWTADARPLDRVLLATGDSFADALAATPVAGLGEGGAVLYASPDCVPAASRHVLGVLRTAEDDEPAPSLDTVVVGGTAALSDDVAASLPCPPEIDLSGQWDPVEVDLSHVEGFPVEPLSVATVGPVELSTGVGGRVVVHDMDPACPGVTEMGELAPLADLYGGVWVGSLVLADAGCTADPGPGVAMYDPDQGTLALCSWPAEAYPRCQAYRATSAGGALSSASAQGPGLSPPWDRVAQIDAARRAALGAFKLCIPLHNRARTIGDVQLWLACSGPWGAFLVRSASDRTDAFTAALDATSEEEYDDFRDVTRDSTDALDRRLGAVEDAERVVSDVLDRLAPTADVLDALGSPGLDALLELVDQAVGVAGTAAEGIACIVSAGQLSDTAAGRVSGAG